MTNEQKKELFEYLKENLKIQVNSERDYDSDEKIYVKLLLKDTEGNFQQISESFEYIG